MPWRNCTVSFNAGGLPQKAEIQAESVYEAVINAVTQWDSRRMKLPHRQTPLTVELQDGRTYQATLGQAMEWLYRRGRTEDERNRKERLRYLMENRR
jgi:hypothetical protein